MFGLNLLTKAVATLTGNIVALASTVETINQGLRGRVGLDQPDEPGQLPHRIEADAEVPTTRKGRARQTTSQE
jgi:hypothetical protein